MISRSSLNWSPLSLLLLVSLVLILGCGGQLANQLANINIFSDAEEIKLGGEFSAKIEEELKIYADPHISDYINQLGQILARNSDRPNITYHFKVVQDDSINAFAVPGGYIYVNLGLIRFSHTEDELAGVISHEVGHIVGRHGMKQLTKQYGFAALAQLLLGKDKSQLETLATKVVTSGVLLQYGREAEREADTLAVQQMHSSGIDPNGIMTFFEKLLGTEKRQSTKIGKLLSTHPGTRERVTRVNRQIQKLPVASYASIDSIRFQAIRKRLRNPE